VLVWARPTVAPAHHILGLPHYKYGDEYPQVPFVEILAQVGDYDLYFTYFPGTPKPGDRVRFKLYAVNRETKEPFREPLPVAVYKTRLIRSDKRITEPFIIRTGVGPEANDYKFFHSFDAADAFEVAVSFPNGDETEVIGFPVKIGVTDTRPLFGGAIALIGLAVVSVAFVKRRKKKAGKADSESGHGPARRVA